MKRLFSILLILLIWYPVYCRAAWEDAESRDKWVAITIDKDEVDAALSDFAVLLDASCFVTNAPNMLDSDETDDCAQNGGGDLRFSSTEPTAADGTGATQIACEIVSFVTHATPASATAEIWVPIASLSSVADTIIYCAWHTSGTSSQPAFSATYGAENVWDSNYKMIQHMADATTSTIVDSTSNDNDGTKTAAGEPVGTTDGQIGSAQVFDGTDDYIGLGLNSFNTLNNNYTISGWIKVSAAHAGALFGTSGGRTTLRIHSNGKILYHYYPNANFDIYSTDNIALNDWVYIAVTKSSTVGVVLYMDGSSNGGNGDATATNVPYGGDIGSLGGTFYFNAQYYPFNGGGDEVRISNSVRSSDWIAAEYSNQNSPSTFAESGSIQTIGAATSNSQVIIVNFQ